MFSFTQMAIKLVSNVIETSSLVWSRSNLAVAQRFGYSWSNFSQKERPSVPELIPSEPKAPYKKPYPPRKSRKPQAIKTAVIAKMAQGANKSSIARDLQITRNCVTAIAEESNIEQVMQDAQLQTLSRVPAALRTLDVRLEKNSENAAIWLLDKCFDGKKIAGKQEPGLTLAIQNLMGNVTVQSGAQDQQKPLDVKPVESAPVCEQKDTPEQENKP
jgi:hypothetical protein